MRWALPILALGLAGCDMPQAFRGSDAERLEIADVNARNAIAKAESLQSDLDDANARIDDLESRIESMETSFAVR